MIDARRIASWVTIEKGGKEQRGEPGDWLITENDNQYFMKNEEFHCEFEIIAARAIKRRKQNG